jgi:hypothetical protein
MPKNLEELNVSPLEELPPVECPVSQKRYKYVPYGLKLQGRSDYLVLYDAVPVHSGMRWGILINSPPPGKPITSKVLLLTDEAVLNAEQEYRDKVRKAKTAE